MNKLINILWFDGRINRLEYTLTVFFTWPLVYFVRDTFFLGDMPIWLALIILYPYFSQGAKRCQDRGINGIKIISSPLNFLWNFSEKGDVGINKYGNEPS